MPASRLAIDVIGLKVEPAGYADAIARLTIGKLFSFELIAL